MTVTNPEAIPGTAAGAAAPDYALLDRAGAARTAFFPRPDHSRAPAGSSDHLLEVAPGIRLGARLYATDPALPTIIYFHGNGEVAGDHDDVAQFYFNAGLNLFVVEFRGYGDSDGDPSFATLVADARSAAALTHKLLDERGFAAGRFVMGRSMGAHSALEIAANAPAGFKGMILESGAGSLRRWLERLDIDPAQGRQLVEAHEDKIRSIRLPVLMIHGEIDELIPIARAREVQALLAGTTCEFVTIQGAGHNDIVWVGYREYFAAIQAFCTGR